MFVQVTYCIDLEQLTIRNPDDYKQPLWPLPFMVSL